MYIKKTLCQIDKRDLKAAYATTRDSKSWRSKKTYGSCWPQRIIAMPNLNARWKIILSMKSNSARMLPIRPRLINLPSFKGDAWRALPEYADLYDLNLPYLLLTLACCLNLIICSSLYGLDIFVHYQSNPIFHHSIHRSLVYFFQYSRFFYSILLLNDRCSTLCYRFGNS